MKYILAVDPSLTSTGYVVMDSYRNIIEISRITSTSKMSENARINNILITLNRLVLKYDIHDISIEDGFIGPNKKGSLSLAKLRGAIVGFFGMYGSVYVDESEPSATRKNLGLKGNITKEDVANHISSMYPKLEKQIGPYSDKTNKQKTSDMYDAVCIGLAYLNKQTQEWFNA